jgi:hypothetical protein
MANKTGLGVVVVKQRKISLLSKATQDVGRVTLDAITQKMF